MPERFLRRHLDAQLLPGLRISLVPYGRPEPQPTGKHAAAAAKARDDLAALQGGPQASSSSRT
uniref:hypothetical protein n=1 Tax=Streptomyces sp. FQ1 TaxID=319426 RepID=UPI0015D71558|nr:hypothetical protein [Streptomyces sp. FQ1]